MPGPGRHSDRAVDFDARLTEHRRGAKRRDREIYEAWGRALRRRIDQLHHPESGRAMTMLQIQTLLGFEATDRQVANALIGNTRSVPLLRRVEALVEELEREQSNASGITTSTQPDR